MEIDSLVSNQVMIFLVVILIQKNIQKTSEWISLRILQGCNGYENMLC